MNMNAQQRLQARKEQVQWSPKKSLGQNFLISDHVIEKIIAAAAALPADRLIEIGPGLGALTDFLRLQNKNYLLIELDRDLSKYWADQGLQVVEADALQLDWTQICPEKTLLVSNLPYQISSSLVIELCLLDTEPQNMVLMFQKEVAQRIRAACDSDDYGVLSVIAQAFWLIDKVCEAGPRDFYPAPKVASRVLRFQRKQDVLLQQRKAFLQFIKVAFAQRRKMFKSNIKSYLQSEPRQDLFTDWLAKNNFHDKIRAENLSVDQFIDLFVKLGLNQ
jgi:16S rRNA (adenine1518-N6/adenine1519-N6)-dimethyltransferase